MLSATETLKKNMIAYIEAKQRFLFLHHQLAVFNKAVTEVIDRYPLVGRLYIPGNGGSAADVQHLAAEFMTELARYRAPLAAEAITVDTSILTGIGKDYCDDHVFSCQITGKISNKDIFLGITTSGQSLNIINAFEIFSQMEIPTIVFTGRDGGAAIVKSDYCIVSTGHVTSTIQEINIVPAHT